LSRLSVIWLCIFSGVPPTCGFQEALMRIAAISDVHGNFAALQAVMVDIAAQGITDVVNLGDVLSGPLEARKCADYFLARTYATVCGNHDRYLCEKARYEMGLSDGAAYDELGPHHIAWLKALPASLVHHGEVLLWHGAPGSDETYWLEHVATDGTVGLAAIEEIEALAAGQDFPLILCGHSHIPRCVRLGDGRLIVNPGSVGLPAYQHDQPVYHLMQAGTVHASYAMAEKRADGWHVTFRLVPYDHMSMARLAADKGRADWASALATGWMR
jgi:predicted phosphodiesterase